MNARSYLRADEEDSHKHEVLTCEEYLATQSHLAKVLENIGGTIGSLMN